MIRATDSLVESFKLSDQWLACLICTGEIISWFDVSSTGARRNVKRFPVAAFDQARGDFVSYCMKDYNMNQVPEDHYAKAQRELREEFNDEVTGFKNPNPVPCPRPTLEPIGEDEIEAWLAERMLSEKDANLELPSKDRLHREPPKGGLPLDVEDIQTLDTKGTWPHSAPQKPSGVAASYARAADWLASKYKEDDWQGPAYNVDSAAKYHDSEGRPVFPPGTSGREAAPSGLRPESEWHDDDGCVLWYRVPVEEPPYVGSPLDTDWEEGFYTHWQPLPALAAIPLSGMGGGRATDYVGASKLLDQLRAVMYSADHVRRRLAEHPQTRALLAQFLGLLTADQHLQEVLNTMAPTRYPASHPAPSSVPSEPSTDDERS